MSTEIGHAAMTAKVAQLLGEMEQSVRNFDEARSLPPEIYTSEKFYEFEIETLFSKCWLGLGHQNQIPNAGDYFTVEIADEPLIIVRQRDESIKVLSATCQHRGHPLLFDCKSEQRGNCSAFTCPYHAWTYGPDGRLTGAPSMSKTLPLKELRATTKLPELKVELFHGFIFANFDGDASPLAPTLTKADEELRNYNIAEMVVAPTVIYENYPWNWKISHENGLEPYHTTFVHKGYHEMAPASRSKFTDWEDWKEGDCYITHPTYFLNLDGGFNPRGKANFPILENLTEDERHRTVFSSIPPTLFICLMPDQVFTFRIFPRAVDRIDLFLNFYYPTTTTEMPHFEWARDIQKASTGAFGDQDEVSNTVMQKAYRSRFAPRGRYSHLEAILPQFNRWLLEQYKRCAADLSAE